MGARRFRLSSIVLSVVLCALTATRASAAGRAEECASQAEHALELQDSGRFVSALEELKVCAADACPRVVRDDCRNAIQEIRKRAPRLFPRVRDRSGSDIVDATITVDDDVVSADEVARGRIVDPGVHVVRASTPTAASVQKSVLVAIADRERVVEIVLSPRGAVSSAREPSGEGPKRDRTLSFIVGGVGLGLLATSGVVGATALVDYRALESRCGSSCSAQDVSPVHSRVVATDVLLGAGLVSLAAAAVLWMTAPERSR